MAVDWGAVVANNQKTESERKDREAVEGIQLQHKLSPHEAAFVHGRRRMVEDQAQERQHRSEQESFIKHANAEIDKLGADPRNVEEWKRCLVEVCLGRWPESEMLRADPKVGLTFQNLRARLSAANIKARPKVTHIANPFFAWK
jgi:hypothetical protein